jgi:hypothetical protein
MSSAKPSAIHIPATIANTYLINTRHCPLQG